MKHVILSIILLINLSLSFAQVSTKTATGPKAKSQSDASIVGHTVTLAGKEHIPYITITVKGSTIGTSSDASGHYSLRNLPIGPQTIVAAGIGYRTVEKRVVLEPNKTLELDFELDEDIVMLDNVVVSATRNETNRKTTSNIVNVIPMKLFESTNSVCLSQGLNFQSGLRVETNCQNCGFQQVRINGLDGPYTQILMDSRPIFSALAGVYGIEQIPANMIERVEVVRGGGSALFGSNAIGGTINIITKEPLVNSATASNNTLLIGGKNTDINTSFNASIVSGNNKAGISFFGSTRQREGYDANGDGFTEIGKLQSKSVGFRSYYKPGNQSKISFEYHNTGEFRRGGDSLNIPAHEANITEQLEHNVNSGGLKYDLFSSDYKHRFSAYSSAQHTDRKSYYGMEKDPNAYGTTTDLSFVSGAQYVYSTEKLLFMPADFTIGGEYQYNKLLDRQLGYNRIINQKISISSLFAQNEWKDDHWTLLAGIRMDKHQLLKNPIFSPRINARYKPVDWLYVRGGFATGFRAPQAFDEDLHIESVGGDIQLIEIDPNLKPENSRSYNLSADFYKTLGHAQANLLIEAFYNDISDVFAFKEVGTNADGIKIKRRINESGLVVKGINLEGRIVPNSKTQIQVGATLQQSRYKEARTWSDNTTLPARRELFRSPDHYGYITLSHNPIKPLSISLSGTYTGSMLVQHITPTDDFEEKTPDFYDINCKLSYDIDMGDHITLQVNSGVQNLFDSYQKDFDTGIKRDAAYIYGPAMPRSFFVGLKLML